MRGKSSSKQGSKSRMEIINNNDKLNEDHHLSGAYISNLVKQLNSSKSKDHENPDGDGLSSTQILVENGGKEDFFQPPPPPLPTQQLKKQVRRRLHTSKPYQEKLLNMAEARKEIVTALKFHRAAMKQQQEETHLLQEGKSKSKGNSIISASNFDSDFNSYGCCDHISSSLAISCPFSYPYYPWSFPSVTPPPFNEYLNLPLPNQPLGLNLNFQDFNLDTKFFSSSSSSSPIEEVPSMGITQEVIPVVCGYYDESQMVNSEDFGFHYAVNDNELSEIRSVGEQYQIEWNDTMNLANSAWWSKFLKSMEIKNQENGEENCGKSPFDEIVELPLWLNSNESLLEDCLGDYCSDYYMQDASLPCMEIKEIEVMDGDWLSS